MRTLIAAHKLFWFGVLYLVTMPSIFIWRLFFQNTKFFFVVTKLFGFFTCKIFRIKIDIIGTPTKEHAIYVGNHLSYIDIPALGSFLNAPFISKEEVKNWPVFGPLSKMGGTVYISRSPDAAQKCIEEISKAVKLKQSLILFPEGTSTLGDDVLPFKSSLFELFLNKELKDKLIIQPFTITILQTDGKAIQTPQDLDIYAWYGDMELFPHLWTLAKSKGAKIQVTFHRSHPAQNFDNRKDFARICYEDVKAGLEKNLVLPLDFKQKVP